MNNIRQNKRKFVAQNKNLLFNDLFFMSNNYKKDNINLNDFDNSFPWGKSGNKIPNYFFSRNLYSANKNIHYTKNDRNNSSIFLDVKNINDYDDDFHPVKINNYMPKKYNNIFTSSILENYIVGEILIQEIDLNKNICIINPEAKEEVKNCEIEIDDNKINFSSYYIFYWVGKHKIKYSFKIYYQIQIICSMVVLIYQI